VHKILILTLAGTLSACAVGPDYERPASNAPASFVGARDASLQPQDVDADFWKSFRDEPLDRLLERALAANHDLRIARANLTRARALRGEARFDLAPTITAGAGHTDVKASERQAQGAAGPLTDEYYDAGFDAAWELDLFGRVRRGVEARSAEVGAAVATLADTQLSVTAEVARNYFELRGLQRQLEVARRNAENQQDTFDLTQARLDAGTGTDLDTARARAQLDSTLAAIPTLEAALDKTAFRLGVLTGAQPAALLEELAPPRLLPELPALVGIGTPEQLLRRRPDVRVAEKDLAAATARIGLAVGDLFPRVSLLGSFGYDARDSSDLGKGFTETYAYGPSISWAAFDLGRVRQRIKASRADADGALARYELAVLRALEDAEGSLTTYSRSRVRQQHLKGAAEASARAADIARQRFDGGISNFLEVLDAQRTLLGAESELARGETELATALVAVQKALGGGLGGADLGGRPHGG
jgi:multidrug efflux system outer membrane protein